MSDNIPNFDNTNIPIVLVGATDEFDQEVQAMLLAAYSRSYASIVSRLPISHSEEASLRERLQTYYQGYGHKSVGQLGSTTIFFEGVSQIAAKAIEDDPLFNGQETSTRYVDYRDQPMVNFGDAALREVQEELRTLYCDALLEVTERLKTRYPFDSQIDTSKLGEFDTAKARQRWENTIKAATFDICRGILPAGVVTNVGYKGTFDALNDHLDYLATHPSPEVAMLAKRAIRIGHETYPEGMRDLDVVKLQRNAAYSSDRDRYYNSTIHDWSGFAAIGKQTDVEVLNLVSALRCRSDKTLPLPKFLASKFRYRLTDHLDFGSFRDLQRHRNGVCPIPLLTPAIGIHPWYLGNFSELTAERLNVIMMKLRALAKSIDPVLLQYAVPMGAMVQVHYEADLNQWIYMLELRTGKTSHQTLRLLMRKVYLELCRDLKLMIDKSGIYVDLDHHNFTLRRGDQTFHGEFQ